MKKKYIFILIISLFLITSCNEKVDTKIKEKSSDKIKEEVNNIMKDMTIDEKIGQLIVLSYRSPKMDDTLRNTLKEVKPGGFILFKENMSTFYKSLDLIKEIKSSSKVPMFISIDEEGGSVQRLKALTDVTVSDVPFMSEVGSKNDKELAYEVGTLLAEELRVFGINMDFAPVIDVYSNPDNKVIGKRSFGSDTEVVSSMGINVAKGLGEHGVIPVYKHFPGHGNTSTDSHYDLPVVDKTKDELMSLDLVPFKKVIDSGAEVIMIGHLSVPELTSDNTPASLSKDIITNLLKDELGFKGVVVTDALDMGALTNYYEDSEICVKALEAGVDMLLMPSDSRTCFKAVKEALNEGKLTLDRINESVEKLLTLKVKYVTDSYDTYLDSSFLNNGDHQKIIKKINN